MTRESAIKFHYQLLWAELAPSSEKAPVTLCFRKTSLHCTAWQTLPQLLSVVAV